MWSTVVHSDKSWYAVLQEAVTFFQGFLREEGGAKVVMITDPPFGGLVKPLANSFSQMSITWKNQNKGMRNGMFPKPCMTYFDFTFLFFFCNNLYLCMFYFQTKCTNECSVFNSLPKFCHYLLNFDLAFFLQRKTKVKLCLLISHKAIIWLKMTFMVFAYLKPSVSPYLL